MANFLYVDNSNVWIEGMRVSAVQSGRVPDIWAATQQKIVDYGWKLDFGRLYAFAGGETSDIGRAVLYGSRPPANDSLWAAAKQKGFEVVVFDRSIAGHEKKVDTQLSTDVISDSYRLMDPQSDQITLVAGDADYVPVVENLRDRTFEVIVIFWGHAARELRDAATRFISLDDYLSVLAIA